MKLKKEYIIIISAIALLLAYLLMHNTNQTHYKLPSIKEIAVNDITNIEITKPDSVITLYKKADNWQISDQGYPADKEKVKELLNSLRDFSLTALVSESKNYTIYDLTDDKKIMVKVWEANQKLCMEFDIGKAASSFQHTFVKVAKNHRVYHAKGNLRSNFDQDIDDLRDKIVLTFEQDNISEIRLTKQNKTTIISRQQISGKNPAKDDNQKKSGSKTSEAVTVWKKSDGQTIEQNKITGFFNNLNGLECNKYIYDSKKQDLKKPIYKIYLKNSKEHTLWIFAKKNKDDSEYPAVSSGNDYAFMLSEYLVQDMIKTFDNPEKNQEKP